MVAALKCVWSCNQTAQFAAAASAQQEVLYWCCRARWAALRSSSAITLSVQNFEVLDKPPLSATQLLSLGVGAHTSVLSVGSQTGHNCDSQEVQTVAIEVCNIISFAFPTVSFILTAQYPITNMPAIRKTCASDAGKSHQLSGASRLALWPGNGFAWSQPCCQSGCLQVRQHSHLRLCAANGTRHQRLVNRAAAHVASA